MTDPMWLVIGAWFLLFPKSFGRHLAVVKKAFETALGEQP